jgi:hypothetical protein
MFLGIICRPLEAETPLLPTVWISNRGTSVSMITKYFTDAGRKLPLLYQVALLATHARSCHGYFISIQAFDSTRLYQQSFPPNVRRHESRSPSLGIKRGGEEFAEFWGLVL